MPLQAYDREDQDDANVEDIGNTDGDTYEDRQNTGPTFTEISRPPSHHGNQ
jgi:hypothetical protein